MSTLRGHTKLKAPTFLFPKEKKRENNMTFIDDLNAGIVDEEYAASNRVKIYKLRSRKEEATSVALHQAKNSRTIEILESRDAILSLAECRKLFTFNLDITRMNDAMVMHAATTGNTMISFNDFVRGGHLDALKVAKESGNWPSFNRHRLCNDASLCGNASVAEYVFLVLGNSVIVDEYHVKNLLKTNQRGLLENLVKNECISDKVVLSAMYQFLHTLELKNTLCVEDRVYVRMIIALLNQIYQWEEN